VEGEYYHVFNRGVDKRIIFPKEEDFQRFLISMKEFNDIKPIGSIYENSFRKKKNRKSKPLIEFIAYCLNPNHYHFLLKQVNEKYKRSGVLFQSKFKSVHVKSNEQLFYLSAYVNFNYLVHGLGHRMSKSSLWEYMKGDEKSEEKIIRIMSKDIEGGMTIYAGLTKIKGISFPAIPIPSSLTETDTDLSVFLEFMTI